MVHVIEPERTACVDLHTLATVVSIECSPWEIDPEEEHHPSDIEIAMEGYPIDRDQLPTMPTEEEVQTLLYATHYERQVKAWRASGLPIDAEEAARFDLDWAAQHITEYLTIIATEQAS